MLNNEPKLDADGKLIEGSTPPPEAGAEGKKPADDGKGEKDDLSKLSAEDAAKMIKALRAENAGHRTKNKELSGSQEKLKKAMIEAGVIEDDSLPAEDQVKSWKAKADVLAARAAIYEAAMEYGINKDGLDYFNFLVEKQMSTLAEDEELGEEGLAEIAKQVMKVQGGSKAPGGNTSVNTNNAPAPGAPADLTAEKFAKMTMAEKSSVYQKHPDLYKELFQEAKTKKLF